MSQAANPPWLGAPGGDFSRGIHDMEYGPGKGARYVVDYDGSDCSNNSNAGLFKVSYGGCMPVSVAKNLAGREEWVLGGGA